MGYIDQFKQNKPFENISASLRKLNQKYNTPPINANYQPPAAPAPAPAAPAPAGTTTAAPAAKSTAISTSLRRTTGRTATRAATGGAPNPLDVQKNEALGAVNQKYDRLRQSLIAKRNATAQSYDTALGDVSGQLETARGQAGQKNTEIQTQYDELVTDATGKQEKLKGSLGAAFAARGLASSSGSTAAGVNADSQFNSDLQTLDTEKQTKYKAVKDALDATEADANKQINTLKVQKQQALDAVDSDSTLNEEDRAAAIKDVNDSYTSQVSKAKTSSAAAKAQKSSLSSALSAEADFNTVQLVQTDLTSAFKEFTNSGITAAGNSQATALANGAIAKKYGLDPAQTYAAVDQYFRELEKKRQASEVF